MGRKKVRVFRLILQEKAKSPKRGALEILGYYHPAAQKPVFNFDKERVATLVKNGAQPSPTVARLFEKEGLKGMDAFFDKKKVYQKKTKDPEKLEAMKKAEEEKAAAKAVAAKPKEEVKEEPKEEAKQDASASAAAPATPSA